MNMAIGIIISAAFGAIVKSLVSDIIMSPLGLLLSNTDFSDVLLVLNRAPRP